MYLVTTTINVPTFLEDICKQIRGHEIIVIGDEKTPKEAKSFCEARDINYYGLDDQKAAIPKELWDLMPFNTGSRKMIGNYLAYMAGADGVIMMDDDNYPVDDGFISKHRIVERNRALRKTIASDIGWFNTAEGMVERYNIPYYPRGYPWSQRFFEYRMTSEKQWVNVVVNQGMVLGDPDIDAVSRLFWPISVTELKYCFALAPGTWSSWNDQNTALAREIIPVYFKPPSAGRNADIWAGYVVNRLAEHMGDVIAYGQPLVRQVRNPHDLREDYELEKVNNMATDDFVALLRGVKLTADNYLDALGELIEQCQWGTRHHVGTLSLEDSQHSQYPSLEKQRHRWFQGLDMITTFFEEYRAWYNFMRGVI